MTRWNKGGWYAHACLFDRDEREVRIFVSRFHPFLPIITIWWWFGDVTFGYIGKDTDQT